VFDEDPDVARVPVVVVGSVGLIAAGALRLGHRALEMHGREVGYETGAWIDRAVERARVELGQQSIEGDDVGVPVALDQSRLAAIAVARATAATAGDRMRVPEELASGLAHLLAVYLIATQLAG
jgi:hypothetical protein